MRPWNGVSEMCFEPCDELFRVGELLVSEFVSLWGNTNVFRFYVLVWKVAYQKSARFVVTDMQIVWNS
jgi:hypothetical protein